MKLVIGGSTGVVGAELIRQALSHPWITTIVAISRRETPIPPESIGNETKLKLFICNNFESYPDDLKKEFGTADACIWTIAVTPTKMKSIPWGETVKICGDYPLAAIKALAGPSRQRRENGPGPARFIYISGQFTPHSQSEIVKSPNGRGLTDLAVLESELEARLYAFADKSNGAVVPCIAKPGMIIGLGRDPPVAPDLPKIELRDIAAALLDQAVHGLEKDTLSNDDMVRIGRSALSKQYEIF
ncbi:hypothetical protein F4776DRAFT_637955 [Hypoxylon sp. NC0597]|nr:hypothetical protein F4776DRAFT_637955 [Hypoxylon sp. NC0597]